MTLMLGESWPEHFAALAAEREFLDWCRSNMKDPDDVGSAVEYEEWHQHYREEMARLTPEERNRL